MTDFFTEFLGDAKTASAATGVLPSVILAQWAIETGSGQTLTTGPDYWNFAGVTYAGLASFPNEQAGLNAYIATMLLGYYDAVRSAQGWYAQAVALGASPWAGDHYDNKDWVAAGMPADGAWTPPNPGVDLISEIQTNNLTRFDGAQAYNIPSTSSGTTLATVQALAALPPIQPPPPGLSSDTETGQFFVNGQSFRDLDVSKALVTAQLLLSMQQASTFTLTLHDPYQIAINDPAFTQSIAIPGVPGGIGSIVSFGQTGLSFALVSVDKQGSVLTVEFEALLVNLLRTSTGAITAAAGQLTRTRFAEYLVEQVVGASFMCPPDAWLFQQNDGYDKPTLEQISRGTSDAPNEDSWTCLQRLATEINWICFECLGTVYFGPESYLVQQPPVMMPVIGQGGIIDIDGSYDTGDAVDATMTITATADNWLGQIGEAVLVQNLGLFSVGAGVGPPGTWIVQQIERDDVEEPEITITLIQPQPNLPEPTSGGAQAAVGAPGTTSPSGSSQQTPGGSQAAAGAVTFAQAQRGKPYILGATGPAAYDCSGLVQAAYQNVDISIPRTTTEQWGDSNLFHVPPGINNLRPGDLMYFAGGDPPPPGHVAMVVSVNVGTNAVTVVDAYGSDLPLDQQIRNDTFGYQYPGATPVYLNGGSFAGQYYGAIRPAV